MSKYGAVKTTAGGIRFDSKREAARYLELLAREQAGEITNLDVQVKFPIDVNDQHVCDYIADFVYFEGGGSPENRVIEDCKGFRTPVYRLKRKLMSACFGIEIRET